MALRDKKFRYGELQKVIVCNLDVGLFLPDGWEGTVEEGFLASIEARAATFWNSVWMAMQFLSPEYQRYFAARCLIACKSQEPLVTKTIEAIVRKETSQFAVIDREIQAALLVKRAQTGSVDKKEISYRHLKAAHKALQANTYEHCPITVLHTLPEVGEDETKRLFLEVLNSHP